MTPFLRRRELAGKRFGKSSLRQDMRQDCQPRPFSCVRLTPKPRPVRDRVEGFLLALLTVVLLLTAAVLVQHFFK